MRFSASSLSEKGPRSTNEDSVGIWSYEGGLAAVVADGLGGMGGGAIASSLAVESFGKSIGSDSRSIEFLSRVALDVHNEILQVQSEQIDLKNMATTFTAVSLRDSELHGIHCGDTRLVIARGNGIKKLSHDQTEGYRLFEAGKLSKEDLRNYPRKHILDSALGAHKIPTLERIEFELKVGDRILITSDGVHQKVPMKTLMNLAFAHPDPASLVAEIEREVVRRKPDDNFSIVAIFVDP